MTSPAITSRDRPAVLPGRFVVIELFCGLLWWGTVIYHSAVGRSPKKKPVSAVRSVPYISALKRRSFTAPVVKASAVRGEAAMQQFILRRLLYSIMTLWLLTMIVFVVVRFTGDPALLMSDYPGVRAEDLAALRTQWGLDKPYITQYWKFISNVVQGELGQSFQFNMPVRDIYFRRLPNSLQLACAGFLISVLIGIPLGMMSAMRINTWWDSVGKLVALMGLSIPGFFVAMVLILLFGVYLQWLPILGKGQQFELRTSSCQPSPWGGISPARCCVSPAPAC